jgi:anti-sigma factor RsiW
MGRPLSKHIDEQELNALVPSPPAEGQRARGPLAAATAGTERHVASCAECKAKVAKYRLLMEGTNVGASEIQGPQSGCPIDVDWHDVAAGLWPELRTQQLITHAARCSHCGPLLRAASADEPTPQEEEFLAQLKTPARPASQPTRLPVLVDQHVPIWRQLWNWKQLVPAGALLVLIALVSAGRSRAQLSGMELAEFAANAHQQHFQRKMALDLRSDSQQVLNEWLHAKSEFPLALPASSDVPREGLPYRLEGARMVNIRDKTAAYIAYRTGANPASLVVTPVSAAVATGGVEAAFNKVTFHYYTIHDYKVVTWSVHGLTYALVSEEGNKTQRSCMVCHSEMRDRDLSDTPTPLADQKSWAEPILQ